MTAKYKMRLKQTFRMQTIFLSEGKLQYHHYRFCIHWLFRNISFYLLSFFFSFHSKWNHKYIFKSYKKNKYIFKSFFRSTQDSDTADQPELRGGSGQKYWSHVEIEKQASVRKLQNKERLFRTTETVSATEWNKQHYNTVNFRKIVYLKNKTKSVNFVWNMNDVDFNLLGNSQIILWLNVQCMYW